MRTSVTFILFIAAALSLVLAKPQHHGKAKKEGAKDLIEEILALMNNKAQGNDKTSTIEKNDIPTPKRRGASTKRGSSGKLHAVAKTESTKRKTGESKGSCGQSSFTGINGTITSPNYPNKYDRNMECFYHVRVNHGKIIKLRFDYFSLELGFFECDDYLRIYDGGTVDDPLIDDYCGYINPTDILSTGNELLLKFVSDDGWWTSYGFSMTYTTESAITCRQSYTNPSDIISSPQFPHAYGNDMHCLYTITVETGKVIEIIFISFFLDNENQPVDLTCTADSVRVIDGESADGDSLGHYCGSFLPPPILTTGNTAAVEFKTNVNATASGFLLRYTAVQLQTCGEALSGDSGTIKSLNYPQNYDNMLDCVWTIGVPAGMIIKFTVTELKLEFHKTCANDYLEIIDGDHILGKYCGHVDDGIPSSSGNEVTMRLRTNWLGSDKGFSIQYTAVNPPSPSSTSCGFVATSPSRAGDRIIDGTEALSKSLPWQASLLRQGVPICGLSVVHKEWLVTAAHCFEAGFTKDDYLILVGAIDLGGEYDASKMQVRNVTKLILHDQYNTQTHKNDIALLKVEPLQMTDYVRAICIPNSKTAEGTAAVISGWGDTDPSPAVTAPLKLLTTWLYIRAPLYCYELYGGADFSHINQMCASRPGKDTCQGDSGGPLAVSNGQRWFLDGVVSFGYMCAMSNIAGVYTRVSAYGLWLEQETSGDVKPFNG